jgi:hypothetical protein
MKKVKILFSRETQSAVQSTLHPMVLASAKAQNARKVQFALKI